jgi:dipeptidyl aminopeptidase/acylaminoacyl peptidase
LDLLLLAALSAVAAVGFAPLLIHRIYRAPRLPERGTPADLGLPFRSARIATANGKRLFAWFIPPPDGAVAPAVAMMHGWGGNAEHMLPFAQLFHREGYGVLLLDARNHGRSEADGFSSMPRFAEDLGHGLNWLARQPEVDPNRLLLLGHSVGAGAALLLAARRNDLVAVVSVAAFAHPGELMRRQMRAHHVPYYPLGWLVLCFVERTIGVRLGDIAPINTVARVRCPVLLVHGAEDAAVPPADAQRIFAKRRDGRTELAVIPGADHNSGDAITAHGEVLLEFLRRYLGQPRPVVTVQSPSKDPLSPRGRGPGRGIKRGWGLSGCVR